MDVRHLELLRELEARGSVSAVAQATHRTVSAVSQQLRTAQRAFGTQLVEPDGRGIRLTDAGRLLAAGGAQVQAAMAQVQADWDSYRHDPGGPVSVLAFPSAAGLLFPALAAGARERGIELSLSDVDPAEEDFAALANDVDIAIAHSLAGPRPVGTGALKVVELMAEPLDIAMAADHPLAGRPRLRADDVKNATWIGVPQGYPFDTVMTAIAQTTGTPLAIEQRLHDNRVIEALVASSDRLAVLPRLTTPSGTGVVLREITDVPARRFLSAVMRPDRARRLAVRNVLDLVAECVRDIRSAADARTNSGR